MDRQPNELEHDDALLAGEQPVAKRFERKKQKARANNLHVPLPLSAAEKTQRQSVVPGLAESKPVALPLDNTMAEEWEIPLRPAEPDREKPGEPKIKSRRHKTRPASTAERSSVAEAEDHQPVNSTQEQAQAAANVPPERIASSQLPPQAAPAEAPASNFGIAAEQLVPTPEQAAGAGLQFDVPAEMPPPTIEQSTTSPEPQWEVTQSWPDPEWMQPTSAPSFSSESPFYNGQPTDPEAARLNSPFAVEQVDQPNQTEHVPNPFGQPEHGGIAPRVEHSAWHRIEVDPRTGQPLANPELAYGAEFLREQRPEALFADRPTQIIDNDEEEIASASGQLAVGHSPDVSLPTPESPEPHAQQPDNSHNPPQDFGTYRQSRSPLGDFDINDLLLWTGVFLVILAIVLVVFL